MRDRTMKRGNYRIERWPPEGRFGYFIVAGMILFFTCAWGSLATFSLLYNDFLKSLGTETSAVLFITSFYSSAASCAGLVASSLYKKFSMRSIGIFGSFLYFTGSLLTIYVTSVFYLTISYSIFQGVGFGLMTSVAYTTFNEYFYKKRAFVLNSTKALIGIGTTIYPIFVRILMEEFGFRGTLAIIAAINSHAIFAMLVMHPIEWHYKIIKIYADDRIDFHTKDAWQPIEVILPPDCECELSQLQVDGKGMENPSNVTFKDSATEIDAIGGAKEHIKNGKWEKFVEYFDLTVLKDVIFLNIVLGCSFALSSDGSFFTLEPLYLFSLGVSKADTAMIIATAAASDLVSRVFLAVMSLRLHIKARYIYLAGAILTIILRFVFLQMSDVYEFTIITAIMGFFHTWMHLPLPLIFAEYLPQEKFAFGFGFFMFLQGNFGFIIGPIVGWIRDVTQSYKICFHTLIGIMLLCVIPWLVEIMWLRLHPRKNRQK